MATGFYVYTTAVQLIVSLAASLGVIGLMFFSGPLKTSRRMTDRLFRQLCVILIIYGFASALKYMHQLKNLVPFYNPLAHIILYLPDMILLFYMLQWLVFCDYSVEHSLDSIKRRYRFALIPYLVYTVLLVAGFVILQYVHKAIEEQNDALYDTADRCYTIWSWTYYVIALGIIIMYLVGAFRIMRYYQKQKKEPVFLRMDLFIIPWIIELILQNIPGFFLVLDVPCAFITLILTYISLRNRYLYLDMETGFYNGSFLPYFEKYAEKKGLNKGYGAVLITTDDMNKTAGLIKLYKPDSAIVVEAEQGKILVLSDTRNKNAYRLFLDLLNDPSGKESHNTKIEGSFLLQEKDEPLDDFISRITSS
jgi:hypothetical protein